MNALFFARSMFYSIYRRLRAFKECYMAQSFTLPAVIVGVGLFAGCFSLGSSITSAVNEYKQYDRTVTVKGLAEREEMADIVIWPIQYVETANDLTALYTTIEKKNEQIKAFLINAGFKGDEITIAAPNIIDKKAQQYGGTDDIEYRYYATQTITLYSEQVALARKAMNAISKLGKDGIVFNQNQYDVPVEYIYNGLNAIKPAMIEDATKKAREVADKFASDSNSALGKIKTASQGQFSIRERDKNNPHIKVIRVVSTVQYYLTD